MVAPLYKPPTKPSTRQVPYLAMVTNADPGWSRDKLRTVEYEFQGKVYFGNPNVRGNYNDYANTYPVGQPFGGLDTVKVAAKKPTVGSPVPGNYVQVPGV